MENSILPLAQSAAIALTEANANKTAINIFFMLNSFIYPLYIKTVTFCSETLQLYYFPIMYCLFL
ncbi:hypothetical protein ECEC4203_3480 [Escherichia coli EC4203]|nr:hypothetical protein ECEC4203_3480 [Escherichia coli EC4203]